jgi:hypothetical protein
MELIIGFVAGLIVGWNFLPQPTFIKGWIDKISGK